MSVSEVVPLNGAVVRVSDLLVPWTCFNLQSFLRHSALAIDEEHILG